MAYLTLIDGTSFEGVSFGYEGDVIGEVVFNTGMTGYQELLTDPSYIGQIVNMTYPLIGNYGVNTQDIESDSPKVKGFIVRDYCEVPSNWQCESTLDSYLKENKIVALRSIDTRALTRKIRESGTMMGIISQKLPTAKQLLEVQNFKIEKSVQSVTTKKKYKYPLKGGLKVAVIDYGLKKNILLSLNKSGFQSTVYPCSTKAEDILKDNPDAIMLTNGPGDPKDNVFEIEQIKKLIGTKPIFGICLGHQLLALAHGADTYKLKYGHRGSNHPVKELDTGNVFITSQNHGYAVDEKSVKDFGRISHTNWNDKSVEGIVYNDGISFSVQFHPEAHPGPNDTEHLFQKFNRLAAEFKAKKGV